MNETPKSRLGEAYQQVYELLCGRHPRLRPWHFQYLDAFYLYRSLRSQLSQLGGVVLDVGCGDQPYRSWFGKVQRYIGIDVSPGERVDIVIEPGSAWPLPDASIDVVLCTQVLEHVEDLEHTLSEIRRILRPGGKAVISYPFIYNEHGVPHDFRRFTAYSARPLFPGWKIISLERQGGIGSTLVILFLNWADHAMNQNKVTRLLKGGLLPVWIVFSLLSNLLGLFLDRLDVTSAFYNNVLVVYSKSSVEMIGKNDSDG